VVDVVEDKAQHFHNDDQASQQIENGAIWNTGNPLIQDFRDEQRRECADAALQENRNENNDNLFLIYTGIAPDAAEQGFIAILPIVCFAIQTCIKCHESLILDKKIAISTRSLH